MATESTEIVKFKPDLLERYGANLVTDIAEKADEYSLLTFDTPKEYDENSKILRTVVSTRTGVEKRRKELNEGLIIEKKNNDDAAKYLTSLLVPIEKQLQAKKDAVDSEKERQRQEKERLKREEIERQLAAARAEEEARLEAIRKEEADRQAAIAEANRVEAARLAKEKAEFEARQRAVLEAAERTEREAREKREAAERVERERMAAEQRKLDEQRAVVEAERRRLELAEAARLAKIETEKRAAEQAKRDAAAAEEARVLELERQAKIKAREEALRPDRDKLAAYGQALAAITVPDIADESAREFLRKMSERLAYLVGQLENYEG